MTERKDICYFRKSVLFYYNNCYDEKIYISRLMVFIAIS